MVALASPLTAKYNRSCGLITKTMIEKIDKIRDLLIVPSVDEQPKMAINQMKILNLLVELRAEAE